MCLSDEIDTYKFTIHLSLLKVVWKFRKHSNYKATHSSYTRHTLGIVLYISLVYYFTVLYISLNYSFLVLLFFFSFMVNGFIVLCENPIISLVHINYFLRRGYLLWEVTSFLKNSACLSFVGKDKLLYFLKNKTTEILARKSNSRTQRLCNAKGHFVTAD